MLLRCEEVEDGLEVPKRRPRDDVILLQTDGHGARCGARCACAVVADGARGAGVTAATIAGFDQGSGMEKFFTSECEEINVFSRLTTL